jgi:pimeloyl-ACP methyl ester carboxylesterase
MSENNVIKPKIYFISGLGADERAFHFLDLFFCHPVFMGWPQPNKKESLHDYAMRMMALIPEENPNIIGLSFGGMLASEIALAKPKAKVVLISSNKTSAELPPYFRVGKYLPLYKLMPNNIMQSSPKLFMWAMSADGKEQKTKLLQMARYTSIPFTKWAIGSILNWKNKTLPQNVTHIHGNKDILLPLKYVKADYTINGGKHAMVMDQADEISEILKQVFS